MMPAHDWTRVEAGDFHDFHQCWAVSICKALNLLIVDLFPPSERDPGGIHKAIWDEVQEEPYDPPEGKPLTVAAYVGGQLKSANVEPVGVGDQVPDLPIFLSPDWYVPAPLEITYAETWGFCPPPIREALSGGD